MVIHFDWEFIVVVATVVVSLHDHSYHYVYCTTTNAPLFHQPNIASLLCRRWHHHHQSSTFSTRYHRRYRIASLSLIPIRTLPFSDQILVDITRTTLSSNEIQNDVRRDSPIATDESSIVTATTTVSGFNTLGQYLPNIAKQDEEKDEEEDDDVYELCVVTEQDLADVSRFIVTSFDANVIRLGSDVSAWERLIFQPATELYNNYATIIAFAEVLAGLRHRLQMRLEGGTLSSHDLLLSPPPLLSSSSTVRNDNNDNDHQINIASQSSLVLVLARKSSSSSTTTNSSTSINSTWHIDVIGSVELRLQPCDAKIPFSFPWLDRLERQLVNRLHSSRNNDNHSGSNSRMLLQPYLCSLCVAESYRGRGIGRRLVQCVENIAMYRWGYSHMYLHVDVENTAALQLYRSVGYRDVGRRWNPFWAGKAADIGYFTKKLTK
jgi:GNAT superfamily N-acetyltransferase